MANRNSDLKRRHAEAAWRGLFGFITRTRAHRDTALGRLALTPNDARTLSTVNVDGGRTMSELARLCGADPSSVTFAIGRLEARGLAERRIAEHDRRVKQVVLTRAGKRAIEALGRALDAPPEELLVLDESDLKTLAEIFAKLAPSERTRG